jgi:hypothetical protein
MTWEVLSQGAGVAWWRGSVSSPRGSGRGSCVLISLIALRTSLCARVCFCLGHSKIF